MQFSHHGKEEKRQLSTMNHVKFIFSRIRDMIENGICLFRFIARRITVGKAFMIFAQINLKKLFFEKFIYFRYW
jgi:hypothetical protein